MCALPFRLAVVSRPAQANRSSSHASPAVRRGLQRRRTALHPPPHAPSTADGACRSDIIWLDSFGGHRLPGRARSSSVSARPDRQRPAAALACISCCGRTNILGWAGVSDWPWAPTTQAYRHPRSSQWWIRRRSVRPAPSPSISVAPMAGAPDASDADVRGSGADRHTVPHPAPPAMCRRAAAGLADSIRFPGCSAEQGDDRAQSWHAGGTSARGGKLASGSASRARMENDADGAGAGHVEGHSSSGHGHGVCANR